MSWALNVHEIIQMRCCIAQTHLPVLLVRTTASLLRVEQFWVHFFTVVLQRVHGSDLHNTLTH